MKYLKFYIQTVFLEETRLGVYKGSLLRGSFGWALKKAVCTNHKQECASCVLLSTCLFPTVFDPPPKAAEELENNLPPAPPPPFILNPLDNKETYFSKGQELNFSLTLFGFACDYVPYFIYALTLMGRNGLGPKIEGRRASFNLKQVYWNKQPIYDVAENRLVLLPKVTRLAFKDTLKGVATSESEMEVFSISCLSPLRFKKDNVLANELSFEAIIRLLLRRIRVLSVHYGEGEPNLPVQDMLEAAKAVAVVENNLHWVDVERYSNRQQSKMKLGGLMGSIVYRGDYKLWQPWLELAALLHLGKQTAFGYGAVKVQQ